MAPDYRTLYASINGVDDIQSINISESHEGSVSIATIVAKTVDLDVGDQIDINMGYTDTHGHVFSGYVKRKEKASPEGWITITANDVLVRAIDFFIVSSNPNQPYTYRNISAEDLIAEVLQMAGLSDMHFDVPTQFTFGIHNDVEVNLVSSYDYARMITDIIAWNFWADKDGTIWLRNRKPYVMYNGMPDQHQPGFVPDQSIGSFGDNEIITLNVGVNEKDLRNKIVVYGKDLSAEAEQSTSFDPLRNNYYQVMPHGFYKAAVLASPLIDDSGFAQKAADYNLALYNRLMWEAQTTIEGTHLFHARKVITMASSKYPQYSTDWYIFQIEHAWSKGGYVCNMVLRR